MPRTKRHVRLFKVRTHTSEAIMGFNHRENASLASLNYT